MIEGFESAFYKNALQSINYKEGEIPEWTLHLLARRLLGRPMGAELTKASQAQMHRLLEGRGSCRKSLRSFSST